MSDAPTRPMSILVVIAALTTLLVGALDAAVLHRTARQLAARSYPTAPGRITHSAVARDERQEREDGRRVTKVYYSADVRFAYQVDGKPHVGRGHRYGQGRRTNRGPAARVVARYPVGRAVDVRYNPHDPGDAVLEVGTSAADRWLTGILGPANVGLLGLWGWAWVHTVRSRRRPVAGGVPIVRRGDRVHVSLPRFGNAHLAWGLAMWTAIAGVFVVGLGVGPDPITALAATLGGALVAALLTVAWRSLALPPGRWMIIDAVTREVHLPLTFGRAERLVVPFGSIEAVRAETTSQESGDIFEPSIVWRRDDGERRTDALAQWADDERADALVAWLREQVASERRAEPAS